MDTLVQSEIIGLDGEEQSSSVSIPINSEKVIENWRHKVSFQNSGSIRNFIAQSRAVHDLFEQEISQGGVFGNSDTNKRALELKDSYLLPVQHAHNLKVLASRITKTKQILSIFMDRFGVDENNRIKDIAGFYRSLHGMASKVPKEDAFVEVFPLSIGYCRPGSNLGKNILGYMNGRPLNGQVLDMALNYLKKGNYCKPGLGLVFRIDDVFLEESDERKKLEEQGFTRQVVINHEQKHIYDEMIGASTYIASELSAHLYSDLEFTERGIARTIRDNYWKSTAGKLLIDQMKAVPVRLFDELELDGLTRKEISYLVSTTSREDLPSRLQTVREYLIKNPIEK